MVRPVVVETDTIAMKAAKERMRIIFQRPTQERQEYNRTMSYS